jgi:hypothetical protein
MTTNVTLLIAAILLVTGCSQQAKPKSAQPDWTVFSPKDGGYSVMLPGEPTERSLPHDTEEGRTVSTLYELTREDFKYVVGYMNYPISVEAANRDKFLSMVAESGITSAGGTVIGNTAISLDGSPGREVTGEIKGFSYRSRVYLVGKRVYLLIVWLPPNSTDSENAAKFFKSFKIIAR